MLRFQNRCKTSMGSGVVFRDIPAGLDRVLVMNASGVVTSFPRIQVQVQLARDDNSPRGDWIDELAVVKQPILNVPRLSGAQMRRGLYFGTALGNDLVAVIATKGGL